MGVTEASEGDLPLCDEANDGSASKKKPFVELCLGMKMMCSVKYVRNDHIIIDLPNRTCGRINGDKISQPYSTLVNEDIDDGSSYEQKPKLQEIFQEGQFMCCKVVDVENDSGSDENNFVLSLDPADVNSDITQDLVTEGDILITAVSSIEDHGYKMYTGVPGVVGYLSQEDSNSYIEERNRGKPLAVGQILWCKVKKCTGLGPCKTVDVTINAEDISGSILKENINMDRLNPGNSVNVIVERVSFSNLHVRVPDTDIVGFIGTSQLPFPWLKTFDYSFGNILKACVLMKLSDTGIIYFSCRINPATISRPEIVPGTIFKDAMVYGVIYGNILVQLKHGENEYKGFVYRTIRTDLQKHRTSRKFCPGSTVTCRVMSYEFMEQIYICSMKKNKCSGGQDIFETSMNECEENSYVEDLECEENSNVEDLECEENSNIEDLNDEDSENVESNEESESRENSVLESSPGMKKRKKNQDQNEPTKKIKRDSTSSTKSREDIGGSEENICELPKENCEENGDTEVTNGEGSKIVESHEESESRENSVLETSTGKKHKKTRKRSRSLKSDDSFSFSAEFSPNITHVINKLRKKPI